LNASTSHETGGRIVRYRWSFGDHHRGSGRRVQHVFHRPGRYTVSLTVTDAHGKTATVRRRIIVKR
jgi:PKD repeat protein